MPDPTIYGGAPIGRIDPVAPSPSLVTSARPLQERTTGLDGTVSAQPIPFERWRQGVTWSPIPCQPSLNWPRIPPKASTADTDAAAYPWTPQTGSPVMAKDDPDATTPGIAAVEAFVYYTPVECDDLGALNGQQFVDDAQALTEVHAAWALARALWMGDGLPWDNPTLRNLATDVSDGTPGDTLAQGIAELLSEYALVTGGLGGAILHIPDELIVAAGSQWIIRQEGNMLRGPLNSLVSPGPGYPIGPSTPGIDGFGPCDDPAAPTYLGNLANEAWIYVTGPVEYALAPTFVTPNADLERRNFYRTNRYEVMVERMAIVRFDPCPVFACKVFNPAEPTGVS